MPKVEVYCTATCPYCVRAKRLLDKKGVVYEEIRVDQQPDLWPVMEERSGRNTVPQIFIGDHHVGGFDDLAECDMDGELDRLLQLN